MLDYEEKRYVKRIIYSRISVGIVFIFFLLIAKGTWNAYREAKLTGDNRNVAENELIELKTRKDFIETEIFSLNTPEGKEEEIRSKFQVAKEGENIIMIVDEKQNYVPTETDKGFLNKLKNLFKF